MGPSRRPGCVVVIYIPLPYDFLFIVPHTEGFLILPFRNTSPGRKSCPTNKNPDIALCLSGFAPGNQNISITKLVAKCKIVKEHLFMTTNTNNPAGKYASVNGISLYYEIHGTGKPLIMLHGGFGTFEMFAALSPALTEKYQVIGVDL